MRAEIDSGRVVRDTSVAVIDESPAWAEVLAQLLADELGVHARACVLDGEGQLPHPDTDLIVLGDDRHTEAAFAAINRLRALAPNSKFVLLVNDMPIHVRRLVAACGVDGVASRDDTEQEFLATVRAVLEGQNRTTTNRPRPTRGRYRDDSADLTASELRVLRHLAVGRDNGAIAKDLDVSVNTVRTHLQHLITKLGARTRLGVLARAHAAGMLDRQNEAKA